MPRIEATLPANVPRDLVSDIMALGRQKGFKFKREADKMIGLGPMSIDRAQRDLIPRLKRLCADVTIADYAAASEAEAEALKGCPRLGDKVCNCNTKKRRS